MRFGSVCSGIEAASVAWHPIGWQAEWFSEIEPFPSAVLAHHYPGVFNVGDMTVLPDALSVGLVEAPDILCGGTPCQAFSVAGLRRSLDDARGNLSLTFCEIANAIDAVRRLEQRDPCIVFWENVPGVLNTKDNAFGCFLAGLAGEDDALQPPGEKWTDAGCVFGPTRAVAWRVLDAQYFGLAQRRKRVFVVASAREGFDPTSVLFEFQGVRRDTAPSREAGQRVAPTIAGCANGGGANGPGRDVDSCESLQVLRPKWWDVGDLAETITTKSDDQRMPDKANAQLVMQPVNIYGGNKRADRPEGGFYVRMDEDTSKTLDAASGLNPTCSQGGTAVMQPVTYDFFNITAPVNRQSRTPGDPCHTLARSNAEHAVLAFHPTQDPISSENVCHSIGAGNGQGCATAAVAIGTDCYNGNITGDVAATMGTPGSSVNASGPTVMQAVAFRETADCLTSAYGTKWNGNASATNGSLFASTAMQVRRLTPIECERLQGFPDNYTAIPWRNKPAAECPDGPRYKALGNSWAVPVVRWIGRRIDAAVKA